MPRRGGVDTPAPPTGTGVRGPVGQHLLVCSVQVHNTEVQMELLGPRRVGPRGRLIVRGSLKAKAKARPDGVCSVAQSSPSARRLSC